MPDGRSLPDRSARADAPLDSAAVGDPIEAWKIRGRELNAIYDALTTAEGKSKTGDAAADVMVLGEERDRLRVENDRLRAALNQIARPYRLQGGLDAETWMRLAQTTARGGLEPEYVADGSWSWDNAGPIKPGEPGTPIPGSMAAAVADLPRASDEPGAPTGPPMSAAPDWLKPILPDAPKET